MKILEVLNEGDVVQFPGQQQEPQARPLSDSEEYYKPYWAKYSAAMKHLLQQPIQHKGQRITFEQWINHYEDEISDDDRFDYVAGRLMGSVKSEIEGTPDRPGDSVPASQQHLDFLEGVVDNLHIRRGLKQLEQLVNEIDADVDRREAAGEEGPPDTFTEFMAYSDAPEVKKFNWYVLQLMNLEHYMDVDRPDVRSGKRSPDR